MNRDDFDALIAKHLETQQRSILDNVEKEITSTLISDIINANTLDDIKIALRKAEQTFDDIDSKYISSIKIILDNETMHIISEYVKNVGYSSLDYVHTVFDTDYSIIYMERYTDY